MLKRSEGYGFSPAQRLLKPAQFRETRKAGKRSFTRSFIIYTLANGLGYNRLGITASGRVGNSVRRNRVKRLLREFFRLNSYRISPEKSIDIAVYVKRNIDIKAMNLASVEGELEKILIKNKSKTEQE